MATTPTIPAPHDLDSLLSGVPAATVAPAAPQSAYPELDRLLSHVEAAPQFKGNGAAAASHPTLGQSPLASTLAGELGNLPPVPKPVPFVGPHVPAEILTEEPKQESTGAPMRIVTPKGYLPPQIELFPGSAQLVQDLQNAGIGMTPMGAIAHGADQVAQGIGELAEIAAQGTAARAGVKTPTTAPPVTGRQVAGSAVKVLKGGAEIGSVMVPYAAIQAPLRTLATLATYELASKGAEKGTEALGVPKEYQELAGQLAGLGAGALVGGPVSSKVGEMFAPGGRFGEARPIDSLSDQELMYRYLQARQNGDRPSMELFGREGMRRQAGTALVPTTPTGSPGEPAAHPLDTLLADVPAAETAEPVPQPSEVSNSDQPVHAQPVNLPATSPSAPEVPQESSQQPLSREEVVQSPEVGPDATAVQPVTPVSIAKTPIASQPSVASPEHEFASTQVDIHKDVAAPAQAFTDQIPQKELAPGGKEPESHVTLLYGLHANEPSEVSKFLSGQSPVSLTFGKTSVFPNVDTEHGKADVLKVDIVSPDLHRINGELADRFPHTNSFPNYTPHMTLAYLKPGEAEKYANQEIPGLTGKTVAIPAATFSGKDGKHTSIPFTETPKESTIPANGQPEESARSGTPSQEPAVHGPDAGVGIGRQGEETSVLVPGTEIEYPVRYEVRELADLTPSHHGFSFQQNPNYPFTNDRDYTKTENQARVIDQAQRFKPRYLVTDNPDANNGPPVVDERGNAIGGNSRVMTLQRVYQLHPGHVADYKGILAKRAALYGIDPVEVKSMKQPVLVRVVPDSAVDQVQKAITDFNKSGTAQLGPSEKAIMDSRHVSPETLDFIQHGIEKLGEDGTLSQVLSGDSGPDIVNRLVKDGIITDREVPQYVSEGKITPEGKNRIGRLMIGRFFGDVKTFDSTPAVIRGKLEKIVAPLAVVEQRPEWDVISGPIKEAITLLEAARVHNLSKLEDLDAQHGMFGSKKYSPEAYRWAYILKNNGSRALASAMKSYAEMESRSRPNATIGMFDPEPEPVDQETAFKEAFGKLRGAKNQ